jgi:hypothetical protein
MKLVTVFTALNPAQAQLANSRLQAAGFHSVVMGELSSLSTDGYALAAGGIRVQVPDGEAEDARLLLRAGEADEGSSPVEEGDATSEDV